MTGPSSAPHPPWQPHLSRRARGARAAAWGSDNLLRWAGPPEAHARAEANAASPPIVICPGFGNCTADYAAPFGREDDGIEAALRVTVLHRSTTVLDLDTSAQYMGQHLTRAWSCVHRNDLAACMIQARGFKAFTMAVERGEWARVLRALLTRDYWTRRCTADPAYTWYLAKLKATIDVARLATGSEQVRFPECYRVGRNVANGFRQTSTW